MMMGEQVVRFLNRIRICVRVARIGVTGLVMAVLSGWTVFAGESSTLPPAAKREVTFKADVEPIFRDHCIKCHGKDKQRGDLRLDEKAAALKGGESFAPAIIPGNGTDSPLIRFTAGIVEGMQMPPEGEKKLSNDEIGLLRAWIDQGAKWPDESVPKSEMVPHWSFQTLMRPKIPLVSETNAIWSRNPIDPFITEKLEGTIVSQNSGKAIGLLPSAEAGRLRLIRRVTFDLIGLPASPEEVAEFLSDTHSDAFERLVDRLLASPHFGERWARHWLDIVKFAESDGFETNQPRPNAWPYRDYVIRAFNEDKPVNQFLFEQLAGDAVGVDEATGFLVSGAMDRVKSPDPGLTAQQRADELHDMVSTTSSAFIGLTVGCARCHNHKFDPITQSDYYGMKAVFAGVQHGDRPMRTADFEKRQNSMDAIRQELAIVDRELSRLVELSAERESLNPNRSRLRPPVQRQANVEQFAPVNARFVKFSIDATTGGEPCLDEIEVFESKTKSGTNPRNVALASQGTVATSSSNLPGYEIHQLKFVNDGRYGNSASWISNEPGRGWVMLEFAEPFEIDRILWSRDRPDDGKFQDRIPTRYRIEAGLTAETLKLVITSDDRMPVSGKTTSLPTFDGLNCDERNAAKELTAQRERLQQRLQSLSMMDVVYAGRFVTPEPTYRLHRGDPLQPKEVTPPAGLSSFGSSWQLGNESAESDRRRALAGWITSSEHPLTARVMVNRIWQFHFGQGLVSTPSDFGRNGLFPSHPSLLDWLASELHTDGLPKRLHRLMVTSATYRQSSEARPDPMRVDAATTLLWRYPPRRLEAESIRDAILAIAGNIDDRMYGRGFDLFEPNTNYVKVYASKRELGPAEWRRMVYQSKPRMQLDEIFGQFDCPDAGQIAPKRTTSITALQALNLLNSRFVLRQASEFASRLRRDAGNDPAAQVGHAFQLAFHRQPTADEMTESSHFIRDHGLEAFCRATFNANEFLFVF
jgi:mono/diheme cytochrome c family protein